MLLPRKHVLDVLHNHGLHDPVCSPIERGSVLVRVISNIGVDVVGKQDAPSLSNCVGLPFEHKAARASGIRVPSLSYTGLGFGS